MMCWKVNNCACRVLQVRNSVWNIGQKLLGNSQKNFGPSSDELICLVLKYLSNTKDFVTLSITI